MTAREVPGGALAVVKDRRLVYARGYGWANREKEAPVHPDSLFRIASISKALTGVAVLQLVEAGKLALDASAFDLLDLPALRQPGAEIDPRLRSITVRQLLHHTGGWDRDRSFDPMFRSEEIARATGSQRPAGPRAIIRYMTGKPLDFDPGSRFAYSNFGYCVLGRVIEKASGTTYAEYVERSVLKPCGIARMRIGSSLHSAPGEVRYYTRNTDLAGNVFPHPPNQVPWPYGGFYLEAMDAHGGWIASAIDLGRFAAALDDPDHSPLLKPKLFHDLYAPPPPPISRKPDGTVEAAYYGSGWNVRPVGREGRANYWHNGSLPGTSTLLVRRWDSLSWAVLFNQRSDDPHLSDGEIDGALHVAADKVRAWPDEDLFRHFQ